MIARVVLLSISFLCMATSCFAESEKKDSGKRESDNITKDEVRGDAPCISWTKLGVPVKAVVLCVHGLGLNSSSFQKLGEEMSRLGIATYAIDVRGFGSWMKAKGHENVDFDDCIRDVTSTINWLRKANPGRPVFLLGESMGGAIALHVAADYPELINGVISACSSGDRFKQKRTDLKVFVHALMGPHRKFDIGKTIVDQASGDNSQLKDEWKGDELDRMKLSPVELMQFQKFINENHDKVEKITDLPVLMVQGTEDQLVKPEGTEELYNEIKSKDKQLYMVEDGQHLIFENGQYNPETFQYVSSWIFQHSPVSQATGALEATLETARANMASGQLNAALANLKEALRVSPNDASAHLLMGVLHARMKHFPMARQHLTAAIRSGKGGNISKEANRALLMLPQDVVMPRLRARRFQPGAARGGTASVIVFNASWCRPCQDMNDIVDQAKQRVGNRVNFKIVDVDEPENADLVDQYSIGPVPTTIFLTPAGEVAYTEVGYGGLDGMLKGLSKIVLPKNPGGGGPRLRPRQQPVFQQSMR